LPPRELFDEPLIESDRLPTEAELALEAEDAKLSAAAGAARPNASSAVQARRAGIGIIERTPCRWSRQG
jgi:hypothetical protein